jgi:hypothetical protein
MATSTVSIANRALQILGAPPIESLEQNVPRAAAMNRAYEPIRRRLLRRYLWNFAYEWSEDQAVSGTVGVTGELKYVLPNDFLRLVLDDESTVRTDWRIRGRYLVTKDAAPLSFQYIRDITDVTLFDACFVEALSAMMAVATCEEVTGSTAKLQMAKQTYDDAIAEARQTNAFESNPVEPLDDEWVLER